MGMFDWLKKRNAGDETAELKINRDEEEFSGLNLKQVIDAHIAWNKRLLGIMDGTIGERPEVSQVAQDNLCVLGKWLYGPAAPLFGRLREYATLRSTHAEFHLCAGEVLSEFNKGNKDHAARLLRGNFQALSNRIQLDLVRLYAAAKL